MRRYDGDVASAVRDDGLRRITRLTWRTGAIAAGASLLAAIAFGHGVRHTPASRPGGGAIVIPARPPAPAAGSGQVTSGAS